MKRILFSVGINAVEALGSVTRMVAIADEVRQMRPDLEILFRAEGSEAAHVRAHGHNTVGGYKPNVMGFSDTAWRILSRIQGEWDGKVAPLKRMDDVIRLKGLHTAEYVETTFAEWTKLVDEFDPDVIVSEFDLMAPIIARLNTIPHYLTCGTVGMPEYFSPLFYRSPHPDRNLTPHYNRLLKRLGLPKIHCLCALFGGYDYSHRILPSIPGLEDLPIDSLTHYTGGIIPDNFIQSQWSWKKERPLIYVYLSIGQISGELAEKELSSAFAQSEFDLIVAGAGHPYFEKKGEYQIGNVHFQRFIPADQLLKQADIAIHHGGQNTTLQCMEDRVPALIFPGLHFERYYNAKKAEEAGCAYCLKNQDFSARNLLQLSRKLIKERPFDEALQRTSATIKKYGGRRAAAELVLNTDIN